MAETFRVLVTGSRHATEADHANQIRAEIMLAIGHIRACDMGNVVLVHGAAPGVDTIAASVVRALPWPVQVEAWPARDFGNWPACGPRRNAHMVSLGADVCLAFPLPGSSGTWDCARKASDAGIRTLLRSLTTAATPGQSPTSDTQTDTPQAKPPAETPDLMAALRASLEKARAENNARRTQTDTGGEP